jgi:hypothetical protein
MYVMLFCLFYIVGYEVVAVNHVVDNIDNTMRKKKKDKEYVSLYYCRNII